MADPSLAWLCLWLFLDGATLSVFTTPLLLHYGHTLPPLSVALAGGAASAIGSVLQLWLLRLALEARWPWLQQFAPRRERVERALKEHPSASFLALLIARATPLPDAPLKLVAAAGRYPLALYGIAVLLGSLPYYFALAWLGSAFKFPLWLLVGVVLIVLIALVVDRWPRRKEGA